MLAADLCAQLKENISSKGPAQGLFEDCMVNDRSRPLLLVFDRACDLFPIFQHNSTYQVSTTRIPSTRLLQRSHVICFYHQALVADLLDFKLNRVTIDIKEKEGELLRVVNSHWIVD
jgi:hypothetical protein